MDLRIPTDALRSLAAPVLRWSFRAAARRRRSSRLLAGAGWLARPYVTSLFTVPKTGTVVLESVPPGSEVLRGWRALGTSPLTTELPPVHTSSSSARGNATRKMRDRRQGRAADRRVVSTGAWRPPGA